MGCQTLASVQLEVLADPDAPIHANGFSSTMPQDFSHRNLKQQSFIGQDLTGANFAGANIRGTNFSGATLVNANFTGATAGLAPLSHTRLLAFTTFLSLLSSLITAYAGATFGHLFTVLEPGSLLLGLSIAIGLFLFGLTTLKNGLGFALGLISLIAATALVTLAALTPSPEIAGQSTFSSLAFGGTIAGVIGLSLAMSLSRAPQIILGTTMLGILIGSALGISEEGTLASAIGVLLISTSVLILAPYLSQHAILGDPRYRLIQTITITLSTFGGTHFTNADLTEANFTGASLTCTDFRGANLTRTYWHHANLDRANLDRTYLENPKIRQLLTTLNGNGQNFDRLDLRGTNLKNAQLIEASLISTDLSNATLQKADLSRAKLAQAQLYGTNLTGACLTGAVIQNWGIAPETNFTAVQCDYIYMRLPTTTDLDPCRKPDNNEENFREGDFSDFIAPIIRTLDSYQQQNLDPRTLTVVPKTLDLYHHEGIDPSAAAIALQQLITQYPDAQMEVVAIEGRGNEKVRLQVHVSGTADRSQLNSEYFAKYSELQTLSYPDLQRLLAGIEEKDARIRSLESMVMTAMNSSKFYIETYQQQGDLIMSQSKGNVNISGVQGNISGIAAAGENQTFTGVALGTISGSVTNTISQLPDSTNPDNPGIKELLAQLQAAIEAETDLPDDDKVEALEQVKVLAESGQKPEDSILQKSAKTAMKILKGTIASLPDAAKLAEACTKLLPIITKLLLLA